MYYFIYTELADDETYRLLCSSSSGFGVWNYSQYITGNRHDSVYWFDDELVEKVKTLNIPDVAVTPLTDDIVDVWATIYQSLHNRQLRYIRSCAELLDNRYGSTLSGSPSISAIVTSHALNHPEDPDVIKGLKHIKKYEDLQRKLSKDEVIYKAFLDRVR